VVRQKFSQHQQVMMILPLNKVLFKACIPGQNQLLPTEETALISSKVQEVNRSYRYNISSFIISERVAFSHFIGSLSYSIGISDNTQENNIPCLAEEEYEYSSIGCLRYENRTPPPVCLLLLFLHCSLHSHINVSSI
jgi:hypothetical protein